LNEESLFVAALEKPTAAERQAFLEFACAGDSGLRQRVELLLAAHDKTRGMLDASARPTGWTEVAAELTPGRGPHPSELVGTTIADRYKLLEVIGAGGMGTVWKAEQKQPVRRTVALKLIKAGMDSRTVLSRFEVERQALAVMDHPNIARVLDGGTTESGRPFFVMEYVKGVPFTQYCDDARLSIAERLALFVPVCQAVQHAHTKGVIHRDLKPSNILVCLYDGHPVPKVIDFGLAKAIQQPLTEQTLLTAHGVLLGTPLYMSPEQAEFNNLDVDARTDIYALGVILYELLTGTTPLERQRFQEAAWHELLRLIKEEEPPRPSARLSDSEALPSLAAQRQLEPVRLTRLVRGELDWIVMKCLEKDRSRRYETASGLSRDVQRYLADESVEACPPSAGYRLGKFVRRNRGPMLAASIIFLLLVSGIVGTTWGLVRADRARKAEAARA
jgi:eukaryotic-like serine/threonine-protein kinase